MFYLKKIGFKIVLLCCILCSCPMSSCASESSKFIGNLLAFDGNVTWSGLDSILKKTVDALIAPNLPKLLEIQREINITSTCKMALFTSVMALRQSEGWVLKMLDASGKIPSGVLDGTVMDFGSFDECLAVELNSTDSFRGQYCMIGYANPLLSSITGAPDSSNYTKIYGKPPEWIEELLGKAGGFMKKIALWFGTCVPSACSKHDVEVLATEASRPLGFTVTVADCQVKETRVWLKYELIAVCIIACLAFLVIVGTMCDFGVRYSRKNIRLHSRYTCFHEYRLVNYLKSFSIYSNTGLLLRGSSGALGFFHGVRFLSATWIILGHTYFYVDTWNYLKYRHLMGFTDVFDRNLPAAVVENFTIPVSSFFFMSGCLIAYTNVFKMDENEGKMNVLLFFVHKYWRMTPALVITIVLLFAMPLLNSGPLWNTTLSEDIGLCRESWWKNLVYISNWWDTDSYCLLHTWYLSALMQFHVIGVILLFLLYRCPVITLVLGAIILISSCIVTALNVMWHDFPMPGPGMIKDLELIQRYNSVIYIKPFAHAAVYLIGMCVGYLILKYRTVKITRVYHVLGWIAAVICGLASVYGIYGPASLPEMRAIYISLHRIGWALALSWVTFVCATRSGGIVNKILSWKAFHPLGDLSYLAYLLHPLVILYKNASLRERVYYSNTELVFLFLSLMVISFLLAYICYVTVELPFASIESQIFMKSKKPSFTNGGVKKDSQPISTILVKPNIGI